MASNHFDNPFTIRGHSLAPPQHGTAEHGTGPRQVDYSNSGDGYLGITPPVSPRRTVFPVQRSMFSWPRSASRRRNRDDSNDGGRRRSRERRNQRDEDDTQPPTGWGARMLRSENKFRGLETALSQVKIVVEDTNNNINLKIDQMKGFVTEDDGRFGQLERSLPERLHVLDNKHDGVLKMINEFAMSTKSKSDELEAMMDARATPPVPPSFGAPSRSPTNEPSRSQPEHVHIGSPLSGPPEPLFTDPRSEYSLKAEHQSSPHTSFADAHAQPSHSPGPNQRRMWDARNWSAVDIKVSKELKPFNGTHAAYKTWANRVKGLF